VPREAGPGPQGLYEPTMKYPSLGEDLCDRSETVHPPAPQLALNLRGHDRGDCRPTRCTHRHQPYLGRRFMHRLVVRHTRYTGPSQERAARS